MTTNENKTLFESGFTLVKNPAQSLVYNLVGRDGEIVHRNQLFEDNLTPDRHPKDRSDGSVKICAEGDSWIDILWPLSSILGYHRTFFDVIQERYPYNVEFAHPGDTFQQMLAEKQYQGSIQSGIYDFFIFSGGGNDFLGGGALYDYLKWKEDGGGSNDPSRYLYMDNFRWRLDTLRTGYFTIADEIATWTDNKTKMLVHGYDYPIPRKGEPWLGIQFASKGYDLVADQVLVANIITYIVDSFYSILADVELRAPGRVVKLIDLRGVCANRWHDELHPKEPASRDFADRFMQVIGPPNAS